MPAIHTAICHACHASIYKAYNLSNPTCMICWCVDPWGPISKHTAHMISHRSYVLPCPSAVHRLHVSLVTPGQGSMGAMAGLGAVAGLAAAGVAGKRASKGRTSMPLACLEARGF